MNKISIIVPVYNLEKEIERCVKSICNQTYKNIEIIIVDDGSKDDSRQVISKLAHSDNRIIYLFKENGGVTSARIAGIKKATGDYIGFVDGDDEIESDMFERLFRNAINCNADISHCGYQMCFPDGRINRFYDSGIFEEQDNVTALIELLDGSKIEPGLWNKLFHRRLFHNLLQNELIPVDIKINEDLLMNYYLFKNSKKAVYEDWCPYHYIVRNSSVSRQSLNEHKIFDPVQVKQIILDDASDEIVGVAEKGLVKTLIYTYGAVATHKGFNKEGIILRKKLLSHREVIRLLPKRTALLGFMIIYMPNMFGLLYSLYINKIQVKKYE